MINGREIAVIILASVVLAFTASLVETIELFLIFLLTIFLALMINILAKKITAFILDSEIEVKIWEAKRWGYKAHHHLKKPVPVGMILPLLVTFLSVGVLNWFAVLTFDIKSKIYRSARRWGLYTFSEVTEFHTGIIAAVGVIANLVFALLGYLTGFSDFARFNLLFAFFNLIPLSNLDGNKIYFGSVVFWSLLAIITVISLGYALLII